MNVKYRRVLLKLSGGLLKGNEDTPLSPERLKHYASEIKSIYEYGVEIAIVIGGGNFIRGRDAASLGLDGIQADYMGMVATIINGMALQSVLEKEGIPTRLMSAIRIEQVAEPYIRRRGIRHLEKGRIIILVGGTGNPQFTTDTTASLRAYELGAEVILKGTDVDGIYEEDPKINPESKTYISLSFKEAYEKNLRIMDMTAFTICNENKIPIIVFNITKAGNLRKIILGNKIGTLVY